MSSRPSKIDDQQAAVDRNVGDMLADDADGATPLNHTGWRERLAGGDPETVAIAHTPTRRQVKFRVNHQLSNALTQIADNNGITRDQLMRDVLAAHAARVLGIPIEPLLTTTARTRPFYAERWEQ